MHAYRSKFIEINRIVRRADSQASLGEISRLGLDRAGSKKPFAVVFTLFWGSFGVNIPKIFPSFGGSGGPRNYPT